VQSKSEPSPNAHSYDAFDTESLNHEDIEENVHEEMVRSLPPIMKIILILTIRKVLRRVSAPYSAAQAAPSGDIVAIIRDSDTPAFVPIPNSRLPQKKDEGTSAKHSHQAKGHTKSQASNPKSMKDTTNTASGPAVSVDQQVSANRKIHPTGGRGARRVRLGGGRGRRGGGGRAAS
jgi:hypothetical protein